MVRVGSFEDTFNFIDQNGKEDEISFCSEKKEESFDLFNTWCMENDILVEKIECVKKVFDKSDKEYIEAEGNLYIY